MTPYYSIRPTRENAPLDAAWDSRLWQSAEEARIESFHPAGSDHRPDARVRMLYNGASICLRYRVADRYVLARQVGYQAPVWRDSCVEFFVRPRDDRGYFNFEINCGGSLLLYYIEDPTRTADGFARFTPVPDDLGSQVEVRHSLPAQFDTEIGEAIQWEIGCRIPLEVFETFLGPLGELAGQRWRGNFYKCADDSSHPHWASWSPIGSELNFHQPQYFGILRFL